jgi:hypothetical protein
LTDGEGEVGVCATMSALVAAALIEYDDAIVERHRAAEEGAGTVRWLRPDYQAGG